MESLPENIPDVSALTSQELIQLFGAVSEASVIAQDAQGPNRYEKNFRKLRQEIVERFKNANLYDNIPSTVPSDEAPEAHFPTLSTEALLERSRKMHLVAARTRGHTVAMYYQKRAAALDEELQRRLDMCTRT